LCGLSTVLLGSGHLWKEQIEKSFCCINRNASAARRGKRGDAPRSPNLKTGTVKTLRGDATRSDASEPGTRSFMPPLRALNATPDGTDIVKE
jgi:hypothetical protein